MRVIDSAEATAEQVCMRLGIAAELEDTVGVAGVSGQDGGRECRFYATDSVEKFRRLGTRFLGRPIDEVELVDLGG
jgi:glutamate racemase